jgi:peroxiredoxin Q/BCP
LKYSLLADDKGEVIKDYGVAGSNGMAKRKSFLVDSHGKVAKIYDEVNPSKHPAEVTEAVKSVP